MPKESISIGLIADDFTGAMDSGVQFALVGLPTCLRLGDVGKEPVEIINTASREATEREAVECCHQATRQLESRKLFKKIDSTLRGHIGAEIKAVLQTSNYEKAVVCPAAPLQGRVVRDGLLYVHDHLLQNSTFQNDPSFPAHSALISRIFNGHVAHLPLRTVCHPWVELIKTITAMPDAIVIADAETQDDLINLSRAIHHGNFLPCGAFGLAQAWAQEISGQKATIPPPEFPYDLGAALVILGSANAISHKQLEVLAQQENNSVWRIQPEISEDQEECLLEKIAASWPKHGAGVLCPAQMKVSQNGDWRGISRTLSQIAAKLLQRVQPAYLVIIGGETASHLCKYLRVDGVEIMGEVEPGIPYGRFIGGIVDGMHVITKAGGFGEPNCLVKILYPHFDHK